MNIQAFDVTVHSDNEVAYQSRDSPQDHSRVKDLHQVTNTVRDQ